MKSVPRQCTAFGETRNPICNILFQHRGCIDRYHLVNKRFSKQAISLEEKKGRRGIRSSGFSTPAPTTLESEEVSARRRELITTDESTVIAKSFLDSVVMKDCESDRSFPNPTRTNKSDGFRAFGEANDLFD